jgi:hypothetical protein
MKCKEIDPRLTAFLHNEVSPTEKESIQAHLDGCPTCQGELERLTQVGARLSQALNESAASLTPPEAAWEAIQRRIGFSNPDSSNAAAASRRPPFTRIWGSTGPGRRLAIALGVVLLLILLAPPALTLAGRFAEWVGSYYSFSIPDGHASIGGFEAFNPYYPTYLPKGYASLTMGSSTGPDWDMLELTFSRKDRFVTLLQSKGLRTDGLPAGEVVRINGEDAVYRQDFADSAEALRSAYPTVSITTEFDYANLNLLAWDSGEIRIELITNLPYDEALKIARSLMLMESGNGQVNP